MRKTILIAIAALLTVNVWGQITETGINVGVGTTSPQQKLNIFENSTSNTDMLSLENSGAWGNQQLTSIVWKDQTRNIVGGIGLKYDGLGHVDMQFHSLYNNAYKTSSDVSMVLKGNGNVGIGTTAPDNKLHVFMGESGGASYSNSTLTLENNTSNFLQFLTPNTNVQGIMFGDPEHAYAGYIRYSHSDNSMRLYTNNTQKLAILSNGNIGIGTSAPLQKLEIKDGDLYINNASNDGGTIRSYGHCLDFKGRTDNAYAHRSYRFYPATGPTTTYSLLKLYQGNTDGTFEEKVKIASIGDSYFNGGNVAIGTTDPDYKLTVKGTIGCEEVKVEIIDGADLVFEEDYELRKLDELEEFVNTKKHLPEIASEKEMQENGVDMGEFQIQLLQKIEELTLYVIELKKENDELNDKVDVLIKQ